MRLHHRTTVVGLLVGALLVPSAAQAAVYPGPQGPRDVRGLIEQHWQRIGGARSVVGAPVTNEVATPYRYGAFNHFERGSIYWSPGSGAHEVHGAIRDAWAHSRWEAGVLGFPTTDEVRTPNGVGAYNHFEGGSIYWSPRTGAREVHGLIRQAWAVSGWEAGPLGFPTTNETRTANGLGAFNHFQGGSVYWSPATGAQVVTGDVRDRYLAMGAEGSVLGFPIGPRRPGSVAGASWQQFQNGVLYSTPNGVRVVQGAIAQVWLAQGGDASSFGAPQTDEYADFDVRRSDFSYGSLVWSRTRGVYTGYRDLNGEQSAVLPIGKLNEPMIAQVLTGDATTVTATATGSTDPQVVVSPGPRSPGVVNVPVDFGDRRPARQRTQFVVDQPEPAYWNIRLMPVAAVPVFEGSVHGSGGGTEVLRYAGPARTAHIVASAPGAAISVIAHDGATNPLGTLASGTGTVDVTTPLATNTYLFVQCDGPWSITFP